MKIDVFFDPICPWCFIGKRRLEGALALRPATVARVNWRPFLLNPEMPVGGIDRTAYLVRKFGSEARVRRIYGAIAQAGQSVEIDFRFDTISRTPNTVDAHRLIRFAGAKPEYGAAPAPVVEALFRAFFIDGRDTGDLSVLLDIGQGLGFPSDTLGAYLRSDEDTAWVHNENAAGHRLGINGVPSFVFEGGLIISGAQDEKVLARVIDAAEAATAAA